MCYCKFRLVTPLPPLPPWWGLRGQKILILTTLDCWKRHFQKQNYIENYFYLLKSTKSTKTTSQKCWRNIIIWGDLFGCPYQPNSIKTCLGLLLRFNIVISFQNFGEKSDNFIHIFKLDFIIFQEIFFSVSKISHHCACHAPHSATPFPSLESLPT